MDRSSYHLPLTTLVGEEYSMDDSDAYFIAHNEKGAKLARTYHSRVI